MNEGWTDRLWKMVAADVRSDRAISVAAGLGVNYVQQARARGSSPVSDKLAAILDVLGPKAALYVLTGLEMAEEDRQLLEILQGMDPEMKKSALHLFEQIRDGATPQRPPSSAER